MSSFMKTQEEKYGKPMPWEEPEKPKLGGQGLGKPRLNAGKCLCGHVKEDHLPWVGRTKCRHKECVCNNFLDRE